MSDRLFYLRKCDSRTFYKGRPKPNGELPSYGCPKTLTAESMPELEGKAERAGWTKMDEKDICGRCFTNARKDGL